MRSAFHNSSINELTKYFSRHLHSFLKYHPDRPQDLGNILINQDVDFTDCIQLPAYEGAQVYVYFVEDDDESSKDRDSLFPQEVERGTYPNLLLTSRKNNKRGLWYISTRRKVNAYSSKWGPQKSFGELLEEGILHSARGVSNETVRTKILTEFFQSLDTDLQYVFLISPTENMKICSMSHTPVWHIGTMKNGKLLVDTLSGMSNGGIKFLPRTPVLDKKATLGDMFYAADESDWRKTHGRILLVPDSRMMSGWASYKIASCEYQRRAALRENESSIFWAYLALRFPNKKEEELNLFLETHSDLKDCFDIFKFSS